MGGASWKHIRDVFEAALKHEDRSGFLDRACAGDEALRREVESLLEADDAFFLAHEPSARIDPMLGRRIGPYQVERRLGSGGMGVVYLALRADDEFKKLVAIKILRPDLGQDVRRFRAERQILAALSHPNIAQLLDGGTTEGGLPYLVMEFIEGRPIDDYCEQEELSVEERIELFRTVCSAVQFAHQNLVVHRDLKPGNVLVSARGIPKLMDFGIAKLLNPELSSPNVPPTATAMSLMTPAYASPEQVRGEPVSTASDVYSLGALLYQLLTGRQPFLTTSGSPIEMMRVVCEEEPRKPSAVVSEERRKLRRHLAGDLDNIVLMALRKQPRRRYGSVEQLSDDLGRYLDGLPVAARSDTIFYRWGKFVRRNRWAVAASTAFVAACLGFASVMGYQHSEIARERDRVAQQRNRAERVTQFLVELFEVSDPRQATGETLSAPQILEMGSRKLEVELRDQPRLRATLMDTVGMIHVRLGFFDKARPMLESALETRRELLGAESSEVAESLQHQALLEFWQGEYGRAEVLSREALEMRRRLFGERHPKVAESLLELARALIEEGEYEEAELRLREALVMRREHWGEEHLEVAESLDGLGSFLAARKNDFEAADLLLREALAMRRKLLGDQHLDVAESMTSLGRSRFLQSDYEEAAALFREALAIRRLFLGDRHLLVAENINTLAISLQYEYEEMQRLFLEALEISREHLSDDHPKVGTLLFNLGLTRFWQGDHEKAEEYLRESLAVYQPLGAENPDFALCQVWLAEILIARRDFEAACPMVREAHANLRQSHLAGLWWDLHAGSVQAACLAESERYEEAEQQLLKSYRELRRTMGDDSPFTGMVLKKLVGLYEAWGRPDKAAEYHGVVEAAAKALPS